MDLSIITEEFVFIFISLTFLVKAYRERMRDLHILNQQSTTPKHETTLSETLKISILVPAWNSKDTISQCIGSFSNIRYQKKELIVIAGGGDDTHEIAKKYSSDDITILEQKPLGKNAALNDGFKHSNGEVIVLTDSDTVMSNSWFTSLLGPIIEGSEDVTTGKTMPLKTQLDNSFVLSQFTIDAYDKAHYPKYVSGILGQNAALKRAVLERLEGFDEGAMTGTDYNLAKHLEKNGYKIRFVPESVIETEYQHKLIPYLNQQSRWLRNTYIIGKQFGDKHEVRTSIVSSIGGITMLLLPFSAALVGKIGIYLWLTFLFAGLLNRIRYIKFAEQIYSEINFKPVYPRILIYMFIDFIAWSLALIDYLIPSRRRKW